MGITAKEISRILNISEAAVSMALNNKPGVSTQTRKLVVEFAKNNGYDFGKLKTNTKSNTYHSGTINFILYRKHGAVVKDTIFFEQLTKGIHDACNRHHFHLNISYIYAQGQQAVKEKLKEILGFGCIGIVLLGTEMRREDFAPFNELSIPVVILDAYFENIKKDCVVINNVQGAYQATNYLIAKYKAQPGYLSSSYSINNFNERADGFYKAIRANGLSSSRSIVHKLSPSVEGAYADMISIIESGDQLARCYFADNDLIASGAIKSFMDKGFMIPKDIAVVGFDNVPTTAYIQLSLTTIDVHKQYMGELAIDRLAEIIEQKHSFPIKIEVSTNLIARASS